jgi:hypothetical protein
MYTWIGAESKETFVGTCKMAQLHIGVDNMGSLKKLVRRESKSAHGWALSDV